MRFAFGGVRATGTVENYEESVELVRYGESLGFDTAWFTDSLRNCYVQMALSAVQTKRISLGVGMTNPYTRNPIVTARAIATIDEVSRGRAILGIATGDAVENLIPMGYDVKKPYLVVKEAIQIIKALLRGEEVNFEGHAFRIKGLRLGFPSRPNIPIFVAGGGPKIMEVAGATADAVIINYFEPSLVNKAIESIRRGAESAGRKMEDVEITCWGPILLSSNEVQRREYTTDMKQVVALNMLLSPEAWLFESGVKQESLDMIKENYILGAHHDPKLESRMIEKVKEMVTDEMVDLFCAIGSTEDVIDKLDSLQKAGVSFITTWVGAKRLSEKKEILHGFSTKVVAHYK